MANTLSVRIETRVLMSDTFCSPRLPVAAPRRMCAVRLSASAACLRRSSEYIQSTCSRGPGSSRVSRSSQSCFSTLPRTVVESGTAIGSIAKSVSRCVSVPAGPGAPAGCAGVACAGGGSSRIAHTTAVVSAWGFSAAPRSVTAASSARVLPSDALHSCFSYRA